MVEDIKAQVRKTISPEKDHYLTGDTTSILGNTYERPDWKAIEINFLTSYYQQDGNNGAVTGGIGTEYLTDFTQKLSIKLPQSKKISWNIDGAYDYYSSASTDNINNIRSSDSSSDMRSQMNIGINYKAGPLQEYGARIGTSVEYDYTSINGGVNFSLLSRNQNTLFGFSAQGFIDKWMLIYPRELRGEVKALTDKRKSYNTALSLNQVVNKRMQIAFMAEATYMHGLLSTPFHRVYFKDSNNHTIESLPGNRLKIPLGVRLNTYLSERMIMRLYYRYYADDWGMDGHTASVELPIKLNRFVAIYPHYRYHTQTAVDYFKGYKEHSVSDLFYTSDYDLSELNSHSIGIGAMIHPNGGLGKMKIPLTKNSFLSLDGIDIKYAYYNRSTGLKAHIISIGLSMKI